MSDEREVGTIHSLRTNQFDIEFEPGRLCDHRWMSEHKAGPDRVTRGPNGERVHIIGGSSYATPMRFKVNPKTREVRCKGCGALVDPFDALMFMSELRRRMQDGIRANEREAKALGQRVENLKREERNIKARLRRAKDQA